MYLVRVRFGLSIGTAALCFLSAGSALAAGSGTSISTPVRLPRYVPSYETPSQRLRRLRYEYRMHQLELEKKKAEAERLARLKQAEQDAALREKVLQEQEAKRQAEQEVRDRRLAILRIVNDEREKAGVAPVMLDTTLNMSAQNYAEDMSSRNFFSHETPEGTTFQQRILSLNYMGQLPACACHRDFSAGENLAKGQRSPEEAMKDWMRSPDHKKNLLEPLYTRMGVGWRDNYWVEQFVGVQERYPSSSSSSR